MNLNSRYDYGTPLTIDGDNSLVGVVTALKWGQSPEHPIYEISYIHNGDARAVWVEEFRLANPLSLKGK